LNPRFWWPLKLSERAENAFQQFSEKNKSSELNKDNLNKMVRELDLLMKTNIEAILEKDGLPHLSHLYNGWGNATFHGQQIIKNMDMFVHTNEAGEYFVLQCDPEGDFHPWQSFSYAVMAGIDPNLSISSRGFTLASLAKNSRIINTKEGRELGHLLFALAFLEPSQDASPFYLDGNKCNIKSLMDQAVYAHHYGTFEVCRKFHLTEGLCAAATKIRGFENYREDAQGFLNGQLDIMIILGVILQEARDLKNSSAGIENGSLIQELRQELKLGNLIENHCYYAGHLIELAAFAAAFGYSVKEEHWQAMNFIINELNITLPNFLPYLSIQEHFYALGHYRRAITLLAKVGELLKKGETLKREHLGEFRVNFDILTDNNNENENIKVLPLSVKEGGIYDVSRISSVCREKFISVIEKYNALAPEGFRPRGKFSHFRRIGPPEWPRSFHYEILDYGDKIGIEIHLESHSLLPFRVLLKI